ncbi:hypothetical protein ITP53_11440 [Nonomuraea sp. K274]|uniref:Uncharacterized protein n=1 Tax=Nonomuraea cypriaca TaxID=1187855 RepID=A0A931EYC6_9ACTN|nr:hypothetical protein [Nonomuraea cypriaca]MBF8186352.1 hypothetical protein [Nonomuraea cypriaca]
MLARIALHRAEPELIDLLTALRADWTPAEIRRALANATERGTPWIVAARILLRLAEWPSAQPGHLTTRHNQP